MKKQLKIFLISILVLSFCLPASAIVIEDKDWTKLQTTYTQYKSGYDRTLEKYDALVATYTNDMRIYRMSIAVYTNENKVLQKELKRKNVELIVEKTEKILILGVIMAIFLKFGVGYIGK